MQACLKEFRISFRSLSRTALGGLMVLLTLCLGTAVASAQTKPNVVVTQITNFGAIPNGGAIAGGNNAGNEPGCESERRHHR